MDALAPLARLPFFAMRQAQPGENPAICLRENPESAMPKMTPIRMLAPAVVLAAALSAGCAPYVGVGIPVGPFSIGVGVGSGGVSAGVGTGVGPVGVGVGVNQNGQVTGNAGVGVGTSVGGANVGVGVGTGTVLYDPAASNADADARSRAAAAASAPQVQPGTVVPSQPAVAPSPLPAAQSGMQWRGADGQPVPECRLSNRC